MPSSCRAGSPGWRSRAWPPAPSAPRGRAGSTPPSLASLLRHAARAQGVVLLHDRVTGIEVGERVEAVRLASGASLACGALIDAAGPWAGELAALAGLDLPVEPRKRFVYV